MGTGRRDPFRNVSPFYAFFLRSFAAIQFASLRAAASKANGRGLPAFNCTLWCVGQDAAQREEQEERNGE